MRERGGFKAYKGGAEIWRHSGKDIPPGTLRKIFREAGIK